MAAPTGSALAPAAIRCSAVLVLAGLALSGCRSDQVGAAAGPTSTRLPTGSASTGAGPSVSPGWVLPSSLPTNLTLPPKHPGYAFPVLAKTVSYGRSHHDYPATDIFAPCGSAVLAPVTGRITGVSRVDRWSPSRDDGATRGGLSVTILGVDGVRYYGSHLRSLTGLAVVGRKVVVGDRLGTVGKTGDARSVACHLHFGISPACGQDDWWNRRGMLSPFPYLKSWQAHHNLSPAGPVKKLLRTHRCLKAPGDIDP